VTRKIKIVHHKDGRLAKLNIYVIVGLHDDKTPGEIFLKADRMGSTISGLLDALAISISLGLQSGVPLHWYTSKLKNMRFEPSGSTGDSELRQATSIVDAISRWLEIRFKLKEED